MKKYLFLSAAALILMPCAALAQEWRPLPRPEPPSHWKISANEMAAAGFATAALLGAAGYLVLRKRRTA